MTLFDVAAIGLLLGFGAGVGWLLGPGHIAVGALAGFLVGVVVMLTSVHWRVAAWWMKPKK